ncbi:DUF6234 family protein [Streptomyces sp. NPDC059063]|uniref:DUF6234 family protein n=1 Tax=unclassified Streptomyces TaxID=2593676 RepID=UPI0036A35D25
MNLPTAPPAVDASVRARAGLGADLGAAVGLLVLEGILLAADLGAWFLSGVSLDPEEGFHPDPLGGYLVFAGVVGLLAALAAVVGFRSRAVVATWSQGFAVVVIAVALVGVVSAQRPEERPEAPASEWSGQVGCRSGGDSHECAGTGG